METPIKMDDLGLKPRYFWKHPSEDVIISFLFPCFGHLFEAQAEASWCKDFYRNQPE